MLRSLPGLQYSGLEHVYLNEARGGPIGASL
jgi:hypothetical protein